MNPVSIARELVGHTRLVADRRQVDEPDRSLAARPQVEVIILARDAERLIEPSDLLEPVAAENDGRGVHQTPHDHLGKDLTGVESPLLHDRGERRGDLCQRQRLRE